MSLNEKQSAISKANAKEKLGTRPVRATKLKCQQQLTEIGDFYSKMRHEKIDTQACQRQGRESSYERSLRLEDLRQQAKKQRASESTQEKHKRPNRERRFISQILALASESTKEGHEGPKKKSPCNKKSGWQVSSEVEKTEQKTMEKTKSKENFILDESHLQRITSRVLNGQSGDSLFVKNLATAVFGDEVLVKSSITGNWRFSKKDSVAKPALCTKRLDYIRRLFHDRLMKENPHISSSDKGLRMRKVTSFIGGKIRYLQSKRMEKRPKILDVPRTYPGFYLGEGPQHGTMYYRMEKRPKILAPESKLLTTVKKACVVKVKAVDPASLAVSAPGPSIRIEPDFFMTEQDVKMAMTCEIFPAEEPQPHSLIKINKEPIETDTDKQDILSASVMQELRHVSKEPFLTCNPDSLYKIKDEAVDPDSYKQDTLSTSLTQSLTHFSKEPSLTYNPDSVINIKEEPIDPDACKQDTLSTSLTQVVRHFSKEPSLTCNPDSQIKFKVETIEPETCKQDTLSTPVAQVLGNSSKQTLLTSKPDSVTKIKVEPFNPNSCKQDTLSTSVAQRQFATEPTVTCNLDSVIKIKEEPIDPDS